MPSIVLFHLAAVFLLTAIQWIMVSQNAFLGILGIPVLAVWGCLGRNIARDAQEREMYYDLTTLVIATIFSYGPMMATLCDIRVLPG